MPNATPYGFFDLRDLYAQRASTVNVQVMRTAIEQSAQYQTELTNRFISLWCEPTTVHQEKFKLPGIGTLQPLDPDGNPLPTKGGTTYTVSYPLHGGGDAYGDNRVTRAKMTVEEVAERVLSAQSKDADWMRRHLLASILDNTTYVFDDDEFGDLTIHPLANNDGVQYINKLGQVVTANHYYAQAAAIADLTNPFPTVYDKLSSFPSNNVSSVNPVVTYVASDLKPSIRLLTNFVEATPFGVIPGTNTATIDASLSRFVLPGMTLLGVTDDQVIIEWGSLPSTYFVSWATGAGQFIKMREHPEAELRGFTSEEYSPDGNHREYRFIRWAGFAPANRIGAVVGHIGNAVYQVPAAYATPLKV